jgi:hypothetical protein
LTQLLSHKTEEAVETDSFCGANLKAIEALNTAIIHILYLLRELESDRTIIFTPRASFLTQGFI